MWNKLKGWIGWLIAGLASTVGLLVYLLKRKDEQLSSAKAKEELNKTDKESAVIDTEVKNLEDNKNNNKKDIDKADTKIVDLQEERKKSRNKQKDKKPNEVEDYWND